MSKRNRTKATRPHGQSPSRSPQQTSSSIVQYPPEQKREVDRRPETTDSTRKGSRLAIASFIISVVALIGSGWSLKVKQDQLT